MKVTYKNKVLEKLLIGFNAITAAAVAATFIMLFGFERPLLPAGLLYAAQAILLCIFLIEKVIRLFNAESKTEYIFTNWYEIPLLVALAVTLLMAGRWFPAAPVAVRHVAVGIYLVLQVVTKLCKTTISIAATGRNPTRALLISFLVLILSGAGLLMLPRSVTNENLGFVDALFTATSATCVTGLIVKDTGTDFSLMGQIVILSLIQLGGLGIVVFGAVFALLLGQALTVRESAAMQDLISARTLGRLGNMIVFIFVGTILFETFGAIAMYGMWDDVPAGIEDPSQQLFCSVFHAVSAFCNAGFSLFGNSLVDYKKCWIVYAVFCPLIILGGLGFGVLYDLANLAADRIKRFFKKLVNRQYRISMEAPRRMRLQTKVVLSVSLVLIILGMAGILFFERFATGGQPEKSTIASAFFQSVTARTAGFNTVDISELSASSQLVLILLMFVGGSPGSTAGGIKTVTFAVVIMTVIAALRKRWEVEMFKRSIRVVTVARAITVALLFAVVLLGVTLSLSVTESEKDFTFSQIMFEASSALGTVGLSTGITPSLTSAGKLIIIFTMLIGRLGPLTLLAMVTFNLKPVKYNYPEEAIIVG